ncbi:MAG: DUF5020 family protein [Bacteroidales bacterium]|nr:DUF5020 family protein [Bacteroidales bacterium]
MKHIIILVFFALCSVSLPLFAQNLQLHYDFGDADDGLANAGRDYFTGTFELFKPDPVGSFFMFVDVDFNKENKGASLAYFEIVRKITVHKKSGLAVHVEYDDGTPAYIQRAWLAGFSIPLKLVGFEWNTSLLYRANKNSQSPDFQITVVWCQPLLQNKLLFTGFVDIWRQDAFTPGAKHIVLLSEPQLWFVLSEHFAIGTELEISRNFFTFDGDLEFMPTAGIKLNL